MSRTTESTSVSTQQVTIDQIHALLIEKFDKIEKTLDLIAKGQFIAVNSLVKFLERQEQRELAATIGAEVVNGQLETIEEPVFVVPNLIPSRSSSIASSSCPSTPRSGRPPAGSSNSTITCAECGRTFVVGSITDSISKHAKESACKPYGCSHCPKTFKKTSLRNNHQKTHEKSGLAIKRKATDEPGPSGIKQAKLQNNVNDHPLKDLASMTNQMPDDNKENEMKLDAALIKVEKQGEEN